MKRMKLTISTTPSSVHDYVKEHTWSCEAEVLNEEQIKAVNEGEAHDLNVVELKSGALLSCSDTTTEMIQDAITKGSFAQLDGDPIISVASRRRHITTTDKAKHGKPWDDQAKAYLLEFFDQGEDPLSIAHNMGRTPGAIIGQLERMGEVVNKGGKVYKLAFWWDARTPRSEFPGVRKVAMHANNLNTYLASPFEYLNTNKVSDLIHIMETVKARGGKYIVTQWQDPSPDLPGHHRHTTMDDLIRRCIGANLGGWLAVSHDFQVDGGTVTHTGSPSLNAEVGEYALAAWLGVPVEIAVVLLHGQSEGYYDEVYPKPYDKVGIDDVIVALHRLLETGNPGV